MKTALKVGIVLVVNWAVGPLVRIGGETGWMVWFALPLAALMIAIFRALGPRAELSAWALFVFFLGGVYLSPEIAEPQVVQESIALATLTVVALLGVFVSPWFIAAGLAAHVAWDFLPRVLMPTFEALPLTCLLFDGAVALYAARQAQLGRWSALRLRAEPEAAV